VQALQPHPKSVFEQKDEDTDDEPALSEINFPKSEISERLEKYFKVHDFDCQSITPGNQKQNTSICSGSSIQRIGRNA